MPVSVSLNPYVTYVHMLTVTFSCFVISYSEGIYSAFRLNKQTCTASKANARCGKGENENNEGGGASRTNYKRRMDWTFACKHGHQVYRQME